MEDCNRIRELEFYTLWVCITSLQYTPRRKPQHIDRGILYPSNYISPISNMYTCVKGSKVLADRTSPWAKKMLCFFSSTSFEPTSLSSLRKRVSGDKWKRSTNYFKPSVFPEISTSQGKSSKNNWKRSSALQAFIKTPLPPPHNPTDFMWKPYEASTWNCSEQSSRQNQNHMMVSPTMVDHAQLPPHFF